jgi:hypothetical protein
MLIEEYDLGAGVWQLTLPGGKVIDSTPEGILKQAQVELREERLVSALVDLRSYYTSIVILGILHIKYICWLLVI